MKTLCRMAALGVSVPVLVILSSCAKSVSEPEFRPLQMQWTALMDAADSDPRKDVCVIRITADLMKSEPVTQSMQAELNYEVSFFLEDENLVFDGICKDLDPKLPECRWIATCGVDRRPVVKFTNGL